MKVFRGLPNAASRAPCALTIGNFDGVHLGHQALLARVREAAGDLGLEAAVMTFEPEIAGSFAHAGQQGLVAQVDTVEIADRECARRPRCRVGKTSKYLHGIMLELTLNGRLYVSGGEGGKDAKKMKKKRCLPEQTALRLS